MPAATTSIVVILWIRLE